MPNSNEITSEKGIMLYLKINGRIKDVVSKVESLGGKIKNQYIKSDNTDFVRSFWIVKEIE